METVEISSGLNGFKMVDAIYKVLPEAINGVVSYDNVSLFSGLESMAQLSALHVRYCNDFKRHAFLLKVNQCSLGRKKFLTGTFQITASLKGSSSKAFLYSVNAVGDRNEFLSADLLIGAKEYDNQFKKGVLEAHYRDWYETLLEG